MLSPRKTIRRTSCSLDNALVDSAAQQSRGDRQRSKNANRKCRECQTLTIFVPDSNSLGIDGLARSLALSRVWVQADGVTKPFAELFRRHIRCLGKSGDARGILEVLRLEPDHVTARAF